MIAAYAMPLAAAFVCLATLALASAAPAAAAAKFDLTNKCYKAFDAGSDVDLKLFVRLVTRPVGEIARKQSVHEVHGRTISSIAAPEPEESDREMTVLSGTTIVVENRGAQMSLTRNFGRGLSDTSPGGSLLDCGSQEARADANEWVCRGITHVAGETTNSARDLRLRRVNARKTPECALFDLRSD